MRVAVLAMAAWLAIMNVSVQAQQSPLDEKQKAVLAFDVRMDKMRSGAVGKTLGLEQRLTQVTAGAISNNDVNKVDRINGVFSAPENIASAMSVQTGAMPFDFFFRVKFSDTETASEMLKKAEAENGGKVERGGKVYFKPAEGKGAPEGLLMHQIDATTFEFGTERYVFRTDRNVQTDSLKEIWAKGKEEAFRLAIDFAGAKTLVAEAVAMGKAQAGNSPAGPFLDLIDNMKNMQIRIDPDGADLLILEATGVNEADAQELKAGLDSLLFLARTAAAGQIETIKGKSEKGAAALEEAVNALKATINGTAVEVKIAKPSGFDEAIKSIGQ